MARRGTQSQEHLRPMVGVERASRRISRQQRDVLVQRELLRQRANAVGFHTADLRGPLWRLGHVIVSAQHVVLQVLVGIGALGHAFGIEADGIGVNEIPIDH